MVLLLEGRTQIASNEVSQVTRVLFPKRFVQVVTRFELPLHFRRSGCPLTVERSAWRQPHQEKRQEADNQQQRRHSQHSAEIIHPATDTISKKTSCSRV